MLSLDTERILLIGDRDRQVHAALAQIRPGAEVTSVPSYFDAIAELTNKGYTTVLAAAEPIERRPEAAVKTLRELAGEGRVVLFGHPTLEPLSRKMLDFGCDDYIITPTSPGELTQIFSTPHMRIAPPPSVEANIEGQAAPEPMPQPLLAGLPLASLFLGSLA